MEMSYYFSGTVTDFLFPGVDVVTTWGMVSLCMGLASLSLLSEGFKVARSLMIKVATSPCDSGCSRYSTNERLPLIPRARLTDSEMLRLLYHRRVKFHILQTFLHIIHLSMGYVLMLAVMTYNAYFSLAVVGGAGLGYYCFALFDLPSKILGTLTSRPAKWPAGASPSHQSEGNSSLYCRSYGAAGSVLSPIGPHVSSQLPEGSVSICGTALGETSMQEGDRTQLSSTSEGEKQAPSVMCGGEEQEGFRGASMMVDVSDRTCLLAQETFKVEVQVHALPEDCLPQAGRRDYTRVFGCLQAYHALSVFPQLVKHQQCVVLHCLVLARQDVTVVLQNGTGKEEKRICESGDGCEKKSLHDTASCI
ncbi:High affinity copper uptake protein 1 [Chionoecetes opilio]|uniref:Copper transport protein n=1 Tax=Chionoecetes opilio TaxID=41210 RepID=A0A8J5D234_CHIOP|nr:High affinity copper uptake protein 1 [Chionoecetes opilio]